MAKSTLNNAVFMAARHGANNNASESAIKDSLAKGLIPFYIDAFNKPDVGSMGMAYGKAKVALANPLNFNKLEVISPSTAMYDVYGINSPAGRYIPNDNLEYRDASPRASADGQISIRDANILKIKVTYAYDIDKIPLMATIFRRVMCTGFLDQGSIDAWSAKGAAYDASNCKYYLNKKLPIVAYATVQMQSNAIQVAGGAAATSPTSPTTPTPVSTPPPTPSTPTTPLQPYPEPPPAAPVTPAPVAPTTPSQPADPIPTDPNTPVACTTPQPSPAVMMGAITPQQAAQQQAGQQKMIAMAGPALPLVCVLNPGVCVATAAGIVRVCTSAISVIRQLILAGVAYETYNCVVNGSCPVPAPTAKDLSDAHEATNRDRTKPGYGGQCTPDEYDDLANRKDQACNDANGLNCNDGKVDYGKADKILQCANARINVARKCFLGGDLGHNIQINGLMRAYGKCMGR